MAEFPVNPERRDPYPDFKFRAPFTHPIAKSDNDAEEEAAAAGHWAV